MKQEIFLIILSMSLLGCPVMEDQEDCCNPYLLIGEWTAELQESFQYEGPPCPAGGAEESSLFEILAVDENDTFLFEFMDLSANEGSSEQGFHLQLANCVASSDSQGTSILPEAGYLDVEVGCIADERRFGISLFGNHGGSENDRYLNVELNVYVLNPGGQACEMNWHLGVERAQP